MIRNGKYFVSPAGDDSDFKELFAHLVAFRAGRPVDRDGIPEGPWTPELLTEAISQIEANTSGVELRTVQRWFQNNDQGINVQNIRWLAVVFGCGDPEGINAWQAALSASKVRLAAKRRSRRKANKSDRSEEELPGPIAQPAEGTNGLEPARRLHLARRTEAIYSSGNLLNLPAAVFAVAVALSLSSYSFNIHNVVTPLPNGLTKQIGFHWAPNWTLLFMVFMPLFLANVAGMNTFWRNEARIRLVPREERPGSGRAWAQKVDAASITFWAVFLICLLFAGAFQWVSVRLVPLLDGTGSNAPDWGSLALVRPDIISVPSAITFTGLAFLYMSICFYLFIAGFILLYAILDDFRQIRNARDPSEEIIAVGAKLVRGVFRCTVLAIMIAICMKLQGAYLASNGEDILSWIVSDMASPFKGDDTGLRSSDYAAPNHFNSLLVILVSTFVFVFAASRAGVSSVGRTELITLIGIVALLIIAYLGIAAFSGFSILLGSGVLAALYGLTRPDSQRSRAPRSRQNVL